MKKTTTSKKSAKSAKPSSFDLFTNLLVTVLVAWLLSGLFWVITAFIVGNFIGFDSNTDNFQEVFGWISHLTAVLFGLILGYRLNTLFAVHKKK